MAKASTRRGASAKVKTAPPAAARKKATQVIATSKKAAVKSTAKKAAPPAPKAPARAAAPQMAAPRKAATAKAPPKTAAGKVKAAVSKAKAALPKKTALPKKAAAKTVAPPKKTTARKAAPPVKTVARTIAVKKAAPRRAATRVAVPTPVPRRARTATAPRKAPARKLSGSAPQVFTVSHLNQDAFKADGLRPYAKYRDLGIAAATSGLCQAHVIRFTPPCTDEVRKRHLHQTELQLVYVLQGWMKNEFEGHGEQMMSAGSCWIQPSGIKHTVLDYSADCEVLEIIVPADFTTEEIT
ncbi:MAG: hypothetical protein P4L90_25120 [Rhodopila sp.]|nr:hypothetical protein [Rhodopila sp.]